MTYNMFRKYLTLRNIVQYFTGIFQFGHHFHVVMFSEFHAECTRTQIVLDYISCFGQSRNVWLTWLVLVPFHSKLKLLNCSWTMEDRTVACRQMGYSGGKYWEWQDRPNNDTSTVLYESPLCTSLEDDITKCAWHTHAMGGGVCGKLCI